MLCFASWLCRVKFYGRCSVGLSGVVSLISLSGCCSIALSPACVGPLVALGPYLLVDPLLAGSLLQLVYWYAQITPYLVCDQGLGGGAMN